MRKFIFVLLIACVAFVGCEKAAEASYRRHYKTSAVAAQSDDHSVLGVKIDAPNLLAIDEEGLWTLGVEGGKDLMKNVFYSDDDSYIEADKGYFAYLKVTYKGCLLNCKGE